MLKFCVIFISITMLAISLSADEDLLRSPYNQYLPNCSEANRTFIKKVTSSKAMACPMFRDEEGFLTEWLAYHHMMGIDHFYMFDDGSIDEGLLELQPWIDINLVTLVTNWSVADLQLRNFSSSFNKDMAMKALLETMCKRIAINWGFKYYFSLDLDEYLIPKEEGVSVVDAFDRWVKNTGRQVYSIPKYNFQSTPHLLEPVHLLTLEAYQTRMRVPNRMNYYTTVANKYGYSFVASNNSKVTTKFIAECCHFHGCASKFNI